MKIIKLLSVLGVTITLLSSCGTIINNFTKQSVYLNSTPSGASVFVNGVNTFSVTPCNIKVKRNVSKQSYILKKEGYDDFQLNDARKVEYILPVYESAFEPLFAIYKYEQNIDAGKLKSIEISKEKSVNEVARDIVKEDPGMKEGAKEVSVTQVVSEDQPLYRGGGNALKGLNVSTSKEMKIGNYFALIIGVDNYKGTWSPLINAVNDARALEKTMKAGYKFENFHTLYNEQASRESIIKEFEWLVAHVKENDNVFVYYSGHGEYKKELSKGYWVPADAESASTSKYISNSDIQTYINGIKSKHTLLVSDACFSGDIFRGSTISVPFEESEKYYTDVNNLVSRQALTSGGIEPVMDGGKEGHSIFAYYLLKALESNQGKYFDASQLYSKIKIPVVNNSEQTPKFSAIKDTGDEGGQFIFIKK